MNLKTPECFPQNSLSQIQPLGSFRQIVTGQIHETGSVFFFTFPFPLMSVFGMSM